MKRIHRSAALLAGLALALAGCGSPAPDGARPQVPSPGAATASPEASPGPAGGETATPAPSPADPGEIRERVEARSAEALAALRDGAYSVLEKLAHPDGVFFSPYAAIPDHAVELTPAQVGKLGGDKDKRTWGEQDGSGEPIELAWADYRAKFVWDRDYASAEKTSYDERIGGGNSVDNVQERFPEARYTEHYFAGSEAFAGMDWSALRLVWLESGGEWKLRGIARDQWTI